VGEGEEENLADEDLVVTEAVVKDFMAGETEIVLRCTKQYAVIVARAVRFLSDPRETSQFFVGSAFEGKGMTAREGAET
jgi:hypothetical protein